jgi:hypothetical protein
MKLKLVDVTIEICECGYLVTAAWIPRGTDRQIIKRFAIENAGHAGNMATKLLTGQYIPDSDIEED